MTASEFSLLAREDLDARAAYWLRIAAESLLQGKPAKAAGALMLVGLARERMERKPT